MYTGPVWTECLYVRKGSAPTPPHKPLPNIGSLPHKCHCTFQIKLHHTSKLKLLGTIFSAIGYGIVIVFSGNCFSLLQKKQGIYSNRTGVFLLIYVIVMFLLSTWALIQSICQFMQSITPRIILPSYLMFLSIAVPLIIWGTEGFTVRISNIHWEQNIIMQL